MMESNIRNILAADCGSVTTTAVLIEQVDGEYRLVATGQTASTHGPPWQDITLGVMEAVRQIEKLTERTLLAPGGWPITPQSSRQQGVDAFVAVASAGEPLQMILVGLMSDISLASARRAAATTYTSITKMLSLDTPPKATSGPHRDSRSNAETRIQALQESQYELILLVGGTDGGAERPVIEMANVISMALQVLQETDKPFILYAGNSTIRTQVAEILGSMGTLKAVDNICPALDVENLTAVQMELENLYVQRKMFRLPGFEKLSNWSKYPIVPASHSFQKMIAHLGRHNDLNVIGVDIGSGATIVATQARADDGAITIRSDAGGGHSLTSLLKVVPVEKFHRWLPFPLAPEELYNQLLNRSLHPTNIATTYEELMVEHAVAREALRLVVEQARANRSSQSSIGRSHVQWNLMIGAGRTLTRTPHPGYAAMIMLDGIEPWGVTSLALDISGTINMLGSIATVQPVAAVEVSIRDTFLNLGTVVAPRGHGAPGEVALKLKIDYHTAPQDIGDDTGNGNLAEIEVAYGSIEVVALPPGRKATLEIRPTRHFDIGLGQPGRGAVAEVEGGILGIIIDARGRPLRLPQDDPERQVLLEQWLSKLDIPHATSGNNDQR